MNAWKAFGGHLWTYLITQTVPAWVLFGACAVTIAICYGFGAFGRSRN